MSDNTAWYILGAVVVIGGGYLIWKNSQPAPALQLQGLQGLGDGVDSSRQDVVQGLKLGESIANLGTSIVGAVTQSMRSQSTPQPAATTANATGTTTLRSTSTPTYVKPPVRA